MRRDYLVIWGYHINCNFTCRYFKLSWNSSALSQSNGRKFSGSSINCFIPCESNLSNKKIPEVWSFSLTGQWTYFLLTQKIAFFSTSGKSSQLSCSTVVLFYLSQLSACITSCFLADMFVSHKKTWEWVKNFISWQNSSKVISVSYI